MNLELIFSKIFYEEAFFEDIQYNILLLGALRRSKAIYKWHNIRLLIYLKEFTWQEQGRLSTWPNCEVWRPKKSTKYFTLNFK